MNNRSNILDLGRFVALLVVMLFHFYSHWFGDVTPYNDAYNYFQFGYLGVEFFFVLTGFYILESLERSKSFIDFWKKKLVRLGIPLVICSFTTLLLFLWLDTDNIIPASHSWQNAIISSLFINPELLNVMFGTHLGYINGNYWFLWVEFQFLVIASICYYCGRKNFVRNFTIISIIIYAFWYVLMRIVQNYFLTNKLGISASPITMEKFKDVLLVGFNYHKYVQYFLFGIMCYYIHKREVNVIFWLVPAILFLLWTNRLFDLSVENIIIGGILLLWLMYSFLAHQIVCKNRIFNLSASLGEASYAGYLLHEYIGILLIHKFAVYFAPFPWILVLILIVAFFSIANLGYKYVEKPITKKLLK